MKRLANEHNVLASIGDHEEDERASVSAGIRFVKVSCATMEEGWRELGQLVSDYTGSATATLHAKEANP